LEFDEGLWTEFDEVFDKEEGSVTCHHLKLGALCDVEHELDELAEEGDEEFDLVLDDIVDNREDGRDLVLFLVCETKVHVIEDGFDDVSVRGPHLLVVSRLLELKKVGKGVRGVNGGVSDVWLRIDDSGQDDVVKGRCVLEQRFQKIGRLEEELEQQD